MGPEQPTTPPETPPAQQGFRLPDVVRRNLPSFAPPPPAEPPRPDSPAYLAWQAQLQELMTGDKNTTPRPPETEPEKLRTWLEAGLQATLDRDVFFRRIGRANVAVRLEPGSGMQPKFRIMLKKEPTDTFFVRPVSMLRGAPKIPMQALGNLLGGTADGLLESDGYYLGGAMTPDQMLAAARTAVRFMDAIPGVRDAASSVAGKAAERIGGAFGPQLTQALQDPAAQKAMKAILKLP